MRLWQLYRVAMNGAERARGRRYTQQRRETERDRVQPFVKLSQRSNPPVSTMQRSMGPASLGPMGDLSQVSEKFFLGNAQAAYNAKLLTQLEIELVINVADDLSAVNARLAAKYDGSEPPKNSAQAIARNNSGLAESSQDAEKFARRSFPLPDNPAADALPSMTPAVFEAHLLARVNDVLAELRPLLDATPGRVLVHCVSGRNRSATSLAALLMLGARLLPPGRSHWAAPLRLRLGARAL